MNKKVFIGILLIAIMFVSGCAISDYLQETNEEPDEFSLLDEKELYEDTEELENETEDIEEVTDEVIEEVEEDTAEEETFNEDDYDFVVHVKENEIVKLKPKAEDPDEDEIIYTFTEPLDENGIWKTDYSDAGQYVATVTASDNKLITAKEVLIIVERVNVPPVIENIEDRMIIDEGEILRLSPKISDPNGDDIDTSISEPVGDDGEWETDYHSAGNYTIIISATDGELDTKKSIDLVVKKKNVAPIISDIEDITLSEGDTLILEPEITDLNGDKINVTISEPVGDDGVWEIGYTEAGEYKITVKADDGQAVTTRTVTVTVTDVNMPPVIIDIINVGNTGEEEE